MVAEAQSAGATLAGGVELIKDVQSGKLLLSDYQYVVAHPNILADLVTLRGLMRKKFPSPKGGTLGLNIGELVQKFLNGIQYSAVKDEFQEDFALIKAMVGTLNMDAEHLEANIVSLLKDVDSVRPRREGKFITRALLLSPPSSETLKFDPFLHVSDTYVKEGRSKGDASMAQDEGESDDEDEKEKSSAAMN